LSDRKSIRPRIYAAAAQPELALDGRPRIVAGSRPRPHVVGRGRPTAGARPIGTLTSVTRRQLCASMATLAVLGAALGCRASTETVQYRVGLALAAPEAAGSGGSVIYLWYPSRDASNMPLTYRQLLTLEPDRSWEEWFFREPLQFGATRDSLASLLDRRTQTSVGLPPVGGKLPLAVFLPGADHPAFVNIRLSEFLVRRGFVVGASSSPSERSADATRRQAADVPRIVRHVDSLGLFDGETVVLIGHSAGAVSALLAAGSDPRVKAVISLDGSDVGRDGAAYLREHSSLSDAIPSLHLLSRWWRSMDSVSPNFDDWTLTRAAPGSVAIDLMHMEHPDFVSMDLDRSGFVDYAKFGIEHDDEWAATEYAQTLQLIGDFLDFVLEGDTAAQDRLTRLAQRR